MKIEEITADHAIDLSPHRHAFLNPYNGCNMGCPFCFWLSQPGWENRIQIKTNFTELLRNYLNTNTHEGYLYLGSVCDPFMEMEKQYRLSRDCLELIRQHQVPLVITTSASSDVLLEYADLLASMKQRVVTVVELARIPYIEEMNRGGVHAGIKRANALADKGLEIWATLAPILPGITDLNAVLDALRPEIPVYVDHLGCSEDSIQGRRTLSWIQKDYPALAGTYREMIQKQDWHYFDALMDTMKNNPRVKRFPFDL